MINNNYPQGGKWMKLPVKVGLADFNKYLNPFLSIGTRGPKTKISRCKIFNYILHVLHTGIQWSQLKTHRNEVSWQTIYHHHSKWCKDNSYKNIFETSLMFLNDRDKLDLTVLHGDGSNTVAKKGVKVLVTPDTNTKKE